MKIKNSFSIRERSRSFSFALEGVQSFLTSQPNAAIHLIFTIVVIAAAILFGASGKEWIALMLSIGFVWSAEIFNTAIEAAMVHLSSGKHQRVKFIKDVSAAAVLVSALTALLVDLIIFIPKIF